MKKISMLLTAAVLIASCEKSEFNQSEFDNGRKSQVAILTRSSVSTPICYPLSVFAFDSNGALKASQAVNSPEEQISLALASGQDYRVIAISAPVSDYSIADVTDITSEICLTSSDGIADLPMQWGSAEITPTADKSTVAIHMGQRMASMDIALTDLPTECTSVSVSVQSTAKKMELNGTVNGTTTSHIDCSKYGDIWKADTKYLLPADTDQTIFTIAYQDKDGDHFCAVTYLGPLVTGTPYHINGAFTNGTMRITGDISTTGWSDDINLNFTFGPDISTTIGNESGKNTSELYNVTDIPAPGTLWEGHVVAITDSTSHNTATLTLLSLRDWSDMTSSNNATSPDMASKAASDYQEFGLENWSIPSDVEARALFNAYNSFPLAKAVSDAGGDEIVLIEKNDNVRYLCQEATKTYSFKVNSILNAGATAKNYHLRLVRKVNVQVK